MADTENTQTPAAEAEKAPWGDNFDAERAWKLVQNLRAEVAVIKADRDTVKGERDSLKSKSQALEDEGKTELQKLQDRAEAAEKAAKEAARELNLQKVLRKHPELEDFADLLTGETEEELAAKAERLAAIGKPKDGGDGENTDGEQEPETPELPTKPTPNLTPGHGGDDSTTFDPTAIALAARQ